MPCYNPTRVTMSGDHRLKWGTDWRYASYDHGETVVNIACRQCVGCNQGTQREWAVRGFHEAQLHTEFWRDEDTHITTEIPNSSVLTLTYNEEHLPPDGALVHDDFQRFMKRLRIRRNRRGDKRPLRYFMCGEYGGKTARPHFHAVMFGETFSDRYTEQSRDGQTNQMSYELDDLWSQAPFEGAAATNIGRATVDDFTFAGASYVAGYVAKKAVKGHQGPIIKTVDEFDVTRFIPKSPEYRKMSTHPGLGAEWLLKPSNLASTYSIDAVKISQWTFPVPKYYDLLLQRKRPELVSDVINNRRAAQAAARYDWSPERCAAAEQIALADLQQRRDSL